MRMFPILTLAQVAIAQEATTSATRRGEQTLLLHNSHPFGHRQVQRIRGSEGGVSVGGQVRRLGLESAGFICEKTGSSEVCTSPVKMCTGAGSCAYTEVTTNYDEQGNIVSIATCNRWDPDPTGDRRDGCMTATMSGFEMDACVAEFEGASGAMVACNSCTPCEDGISVSMDCTNVVSAKEPYTCQLLDLNDGGEIPFATETAATPGTASSPGTPSNTIPAPAPSGATDGTPPSSAPSSDATARHTGVFVGLGVVAFPLLAELAEWITGFPDVVITVT
jgi:hypothetical protein